MPMQKDTYSIADLRRSPKAMLQCDGWASWAAAAKRESALSSPVPCLPRPIKSKGTKAHKIKGNHETCETCETCKSRNAELPQ